jgi:hypothetical protein
MVVGSFAGWAYFGDTSIRQSRRMKLAREYLPEITNIVCSHPEFRNVRVGVGTAKTGCLLVVGTVETHTQLIRLRGVVAASKPPLEVMYRVKVLEDYSTRPGRD